MYFFSPPAPSVLDIAVNHHSSSLFPIKVPPKPKRLPVGDNMPVQTRSMTGGQELMASPNGPYAHLLHKPGGTIGEIGDRFTAGNMSHTGAYNAPVGSFFEATGRERIIGPAYLQRGKVASAATGPRYSELASKKETYNPGTPWFGSQGSKRWHTEAAPPARFDVSSAYKTMFTSAPSEVGL